MRRRCLVLLSLLALAAPPLEAQYTRPSGAFSLDRAPPAVVGEIRGELRSSAPDWDRVLRLFFGADGYDQGIPDLVVYLPADGPARQALLHRGRVVRNLDGQTFLYLLVFSERSIPPAVAGGPHLTVSVRSMETAKDPFLTAFVNALASRLDASVPRPEAGEDQDAGLKLTLRDVRTDTAAADRLDAAMGRVPLESNTLIRVTMTPLDGFELDRQISLHYMLGNSDGSRFGISLGPGFTLNARRPKFDEGTPAGSDAYLRSSLYFFGQVYVDRPHLPRDRFSLGLAFGTNLLRGDLLDDLVLGVSIGRIDDLGLIVGTNVLDWQVPVADGGVRDTRRWRPFLGIDFRL